MQLKLEVIAKLRSCVSSGSRIAMPLRGGASLRASAPSAIARDRKVMDVGDQLLGEVERGDAFRAVARAAERDEQRRRVWRRR